MLFALFFSVWNPELSQTEVFVIDHALTGSDCIAALESFAGLNRYGVVSCEIDGASK